MFGTQNSAPAAASNGIDMSSFASIFPAMNGASTNAGSTAREKKPAAKIWLNFGYNRPVTDAQGQASTVFVSLPFGIPVDTQDTKDLKGSTNMVQLRKWQNELLEEVVRIGNELQPGDERILAFDGTNGLAIQIRRVREEVAAEQVDSGERFTLRCHGEAPVAQNA
jgi:hypothetical protein